MEAVMSFLNLNEIRGSSRKGGWRKKDGGGIKREREDGDTERRG